jgi:hypothetical protein
MVETRAFMARASDRSRVSRAFTFLFLSLFLFLFSFGGPARAV